MTLKKFHCGGMNVLLLRSSDQHLPQYPLKVELRQSHNHTVESAAALCHRAVDQSVHSDFEQLFTAGFSPSAAPHLHQYDRHKLYAEFLGRIATRAFVE